MADWTKVEQITQDALLPLFLKKLESMGADGASSVERAKEAVELGAKFVVRKLQGEDVSADLAFVEGALFGIAANAFADATDRKEWTAFALGALNALLEVLPAILLAVL